MLFDPTKIKLNESNSDLSLQDMPSAPSPKEEDNSNPSKRIIPEPRSSSSPPIQDAKFIAIDEVSMMEKELLDCTDAFLRRLMNKDEPFGGKLLVIIFDLRQLPSVVIHGS